MTHGRITRCPKAFKEFEWPDWEKGKRGLLRGHRRINTEEGGRRVNGIAGYK